MSARFLTPLVLAKPPGAEFWTVDEPFVFDSPALGVTITVPRGFLTDLASVPRLPVIYLLTGATGDEPAVIHDFLYTTKPCTRAQADAVFYEAAIACGMPRWRAWLMWAGIRAGGASHWSA